MIVALIILAGCMYMICREDPYAKAVRKSLKQWKVSTLVAEARGLPVPIQPMAFPIKYDDGIVRYRKPNGDIVS